MTVDELRGYILDGVRAVFLENQQLSKIVKDEKLLSLDETSEFLKVSKVTIHKWKKRKLIKSYRIGRRIYFKRDEILECLTSITKSH